MTLAQAANSVYAHVAVIVVAHYSARRLTSARFTDAVTAFLLGISIGSHDGFWRGIALVAIGIASIFAFYFVAGVAAAIWRIRRG